MDRLRTYSWPGNIRELENVLETAAIMSGNEIITPAALPRRVLENGAAIAGILPDAAQEAELEPPAPIAAQARAQKDDDRPARKPVEAATLMRDLEAEAIRHALQEYNCNISKVSRSLGISRSTVYRKMREIGINRTFTVN